MDVYENCEVVSLDAIKSMTYNMNFAEDIDGSELWDVPISIEDIKDRDEWGRQKISNRF